MPKRTIKQARQRFADLEPGINDYWRTAYQRELDAATNAAAVRANEEADKLVAAGLAERQEVLQGICELRDEFEALAEAGKLGRISAKDYTGRIQELQGRKADLERREGTLARHVQRIEEIEHDPADWVDRTFHEKYSSLRPEFSF